MPMRRDQALPDLCPRSVLRAPQTDRLGAIFQRALRAACASTLLAAAGCGTSHREGSPAGEAGRAARPGVAGSSPGTPHDPRVDDARCKGNFWAPLDGLDPAEPIDHATFLVGYSGGLRTMERAAMGTACSTQSTSCMDAFELAKQNSNLAYTRSCGMVGPCAYYVVTTSGDTVERYATREEFLAFLGPINTPQEALLLLDYDGFTVTCQKNPITVPSDIGPSPVHEVADGFEATVLELVNNCLFMYDQVELHVSRTGVVKELSRKRLSWMGPCAGRRPEGWVSAIPTDFAGGLADHFTRMAELEAASVTAFEVLATELAHYDAPRELIARLRVAAREEVEHAHATADLARAFGGRPQPAQLASKPIRTLEAIAIDNAVEGCVRETFGAAVGCYQAERATDPRVAALMRRLAADETSHAALALDLQAWLLPQLSACARARVEAARAAAVSALALEARAEPAAALRELAGLPGAREATQLHATLRAELWS